MDYILCVHYQVVRLILGVKEAVLCSQVELHFSRKARECKNIQRTHHCCYVNMNACVSYFKVQTLSKLQTYT